MHVHVDVEHVEHRAAYCYFPHLLWLKAPSVDSCPFLGSDIIIPGRIFRPQSKGRMHDEHRQRSTMRDGSTWNTWGQLLQPCRCWIQDMPPEERAVRLEAPLKLQIAGGMIGDFLMVVRCWFSRWDRRVRFVYCNIFPYYHVVSV